MTEKTSLKILVIGSGGREHAILWRLARSTGVTSLHAAPGNPGIAKLAKCHAIEVNQIDQLVALAKEQRFDLTIVGPEVPLSLGIVDAFKKERCGEIFGPSAAAAKLESSKSFCKEVMLAAGVPTARAEVAIGKNELQTKLKSWKAPLVLKADGLAAGKGVVVCQSQNEITEGVEYLTETIKADQILIEEFLPGTEVSFIVATDGEAIVPFPPSHDYKRISDGDQGPNTGGMGSVCPTARLAESQYQAVIDQVFVPMLTEMRKRDTPFCGFLYAGLMINPNGSFSVLEFNARLGDPETESIMRIVGSNFAKVILNLASGKANQESFALSKEIAVCIVAAAKGYPAKPETGMEISGIELAEQLSNVVVFQAGTKLEGLKLVSNGGRVLAVTATGPDQASAKRLAYKGLDIIQFAGRHARRDIAD